MKIYQASQQFGKLSPHLSKNVSRWLLPSFGAPLARLTSYHLLNLVLGPSPSLIQGLGRQMVCERLGLEAASLVQKHGPYILSQANLLSQSLGQHGVQAVSHTQHYFAQYRQKSALMARAEMHSDVREPEWIFVEHAKARVA